MERNLLIQLAKEKQPDLSLLCHLAKKITSTSSFISEIFLPFFEKLNTYEYEIQVELSKVYSIHGKKEQNAYWLNNTKLIPVVTHHWLISQLMINPQDTIEKNNTLYQIKNALYDINCNTRQQLEQLLQVLTLQNNIYDNEILRLLENGIQNSKLSYELSEKILHYLLTSSQYEIVFSTCELIRKYPFIFSTIPEVNLRIVMQRGGDYEHLALHTLGTWGNNHIFEDVIQGKSWQLESKRAILPFLPLTTELMDTLTEYLTLYPTYSIDWLDTMLNGADQGIYVSKKRIAKLVQHYFEYEFISAKQLVHLVHEKLKEELFNLSLGNIDFDFQKRINIYQELNTIYAREKIVVHLKEIKDSTQLSILLNSIAKLKIIEAESYIFPHIHHHPKICLEALSYIGSSKTIAHLKELLEFDVPVKQNIPSFEKEALVLLAEMVPDQHVIINYLQKHKLPHIHLPNLHLTLSAINESYLLQILNDEEINTVKYGIAKLGELGTLDSLEPVIKKIGIVAPDSSNQWGYTTTNIAWEASKKIVDRAYDQHKIRTKEKNKKTTINTVLTDVLLKQFEMPLSDTEATLYLNYISEVIPNEFRLEKLSILAVSINPHVIKFYISYLGKINTNTAIKQLKEELKITQNIYTLRQALLALTVLKNNSVEKLIIPLLEHPNMNIKKTAAAYLTENGTVKSVVAMVQLFKQNDNTGLRTELEQGLKKILGDTYYFFLFNECFSCEVSWQRKLLENIITNDKVIKEEHYIDFPELNTIAPLEKNTPNPKKDSKLIMEWKTIRNRTKKDLAKFEKSEELISEIETIKQKAGYVFITDLIANSLRKLEKTPLSKNFKTILTSEEAHIEIATNCIDTGVFLLETLLLDAKNEQIEYINLISCKEYKKKEKLFFHFVNHYGLEKVVTKLIKKNQVIFLQKLFLNPKIIHPKYLPLLVIFYSILKKEGNKNMISFLESFIEKHSFSSNNHQKMLFFETATIDEKINKLASYDAQQQSLLKKEIIQLYKTSNWKQRNVLLQSIKKRDNHAALFEFSFTHYLTGKKLSYNSLNTSQIQKFEKHSEAIEKTKKISHRLHYHSNDFILAYVKEVTSDQEVDSMLLHSFYQLNTERKWEILKNEIEQGNWYWFSFFNNFAPINTELKKWFKKASKEGKLEFIKEIVNTNKSLYLPQFEKELLLFVKESKEPIVWQLLFNLQLKKNEKELTVEFVNEYVGYTTLIKIKILSHLLHTTFTTFVHSSIFNTLVPIDKNEEALLIQLQLKTLDYGIVNIDIIITLLKQLTKQNMALAKQNLIEVLKMNIGLAKQMQILNECYTITALSNTVTIQISHLFSTERLTLSFLTTENKKEFYKQVGKLIDVNNAEIDKKGLLKNLADESPEEIKLVLINVLSSKKKTELDTLCLRLLKKISSKAVYLEICHTLLSSEKENLFKSIIRTLSFASYSAAIPSFIKLLSHKKFSKDAQEGLLIVGEKAIPFLIKVINKERPDKRNVLNQLVAEIKRNVK